MKEKWKAVPGYSYYEISSHGRVRSLDRPCNGLRWGWCPVVSVRRGKILKLRSDKDGYLTVALTDDEGIKKYYRVHQLVARVFIGKPPKNKSLVMHLDDDVTNNHWKNLRWGSPKDNSKDMTYKVRQARGSKAGNAKLTENEVLSMAKLFRAGHTLESVGLEFGVSKSTAAQIRSGRTWSHVTGF